MPSPLKITLQFLEPLTIDQHVPLPTILNILKGQGSFCIFTLLTLPFCIPLQIPGTSTPFGLLIAFIAIRKIFKKRITYPKFLSNKSITGPHLKKIVRIGFKFEQFISKYTVNRLNFVSKTHFAQVLQYLVIAISSLILALPLPIPLTNIFFAWIVLLISIGHLMNDGLYVLLGYSILFGSVLFFFHIF